MKRKRSILGKGLMHYMIKCFNLFTAGRAYGFKEGEGFITNRNILELYIGREQVDYSIAAAWDFLSQDFPLEGGFSVHCNQESHLWRMFHKNNLL